jgi:hypothetical protein
VPLFWTRGQDCAGIPYLESTDQDTMNLNKNHNYYYQIQGQLNISGRSTCMFVVYTFEDMFVEHISVDQDMWRHSMVPKLKAFYECHYMEHVALNM